MAEARYKVKFLGPHEIVLGSPGISRSDENTANVATPGRGTWTYMRDGIAVVFAGYLYGRARLIKDLNQSDDDESIYCDARLITMAFERWNDAFVEHLIGEFAFALWNARDEVLLLATDHIGSRPLYWFRRGNRVTFSTSIRDLPEIAAGGACIDEAAIADYLARPDRPLKNTFIKGVRRVPPGSIEFISRSRTRLHRYWPLVERPTLMFSGSADYPRACRIIVEDAIGDRITSVDRVGVHVSGGVDSTGITAIAAAALGRRGRRLVGAYCWSPDWSAENPDLGLHDERHRVLACVGDAAPIRFAAERIRLTGFLRRPMEFEGTADLADEVPVLARVAADNADLVLSGWGGDEAFSSHGFGYLAHLAVRGQWGTMARFMRSELRSLRRAGPVASMLWHDAVQPILPAMVRRHIYSHQIRYSRLCFMSENLRRRYADRIRDRSQTLIFGPDIRQNIRHHLEWGHLAMRMETWAAWSQAYGFAYSYPLLDRRLLEFLLAIPPQALFIGDRPRGLALAALDDVLPANPMKDDVANERLRQKAREGALQLIALETEAGTLLSGNCPWLDMAALRACALNPKPQDTSDGVETFAELFAAIRVWHLWSRHA